MALRINLILLQVYSKLQEWFSEGIWDLWPCLSLTTVCGWGSVSSWSVVKWRLLVVRALCPSACPGPPSWPLHPPTRGPPSLSAEQAAAWPGFYLLLSFRCRAPVSQTAPLHDWRLWSFVQSQRLPAVSCSSYEKFTGCFRLCLTVALKERVREAKGSEGKGGEIPLRWAVFPQTKACPPAMCCGSPGCQISGD